MYKRKDLQAILSSEEEKGTKQDIQNMVTLCNKERNKIMGSCLLV